LTKVRELYEFWGAESYAALEAELGESLDPRGRDWLFELFASLGPRAGDVVVDIGARDGKHVRRLVEEHGVEGIALDPVPQADDVLEGTIEELPLANSSADWIWCRDVLVHVDVDRGLGEWRERMIEEGEWDANEALLRVSRLRRLGVTGSEAEAYAADKVWGVYQLLGKLCPTVYLWERRV
jgi:Methyltransferase domain